MAKKYVPSGYQIINLGDVNTSSSVTITNFVGDYKILHDLFVKSMESFPFITKPILLYLYDSTNIFQIIDIVNLTIDYGSEYAYLYCRLFDSIRLKITIEETKITIERIGE